MTSEAGNLTDRAEAVVPATSIDPDAAVLILDAAGRIRSVGGATERIFGYAASEILGEPVELLFPRAGAGQDGNLLATYLNKDQAARLRYGHEILARRRDGSTFPADFGIQEETRGGRPALVCRLADISVRVEVERQLQVAHRRQSIIKTLLEISLIDIPLDTLLERALDVLLTIDWLPLRDGMGAIHLVEHEPGVLILRAMRGFPAAMRTACGRVRFGDCVCGTAAQLRQVMCVGGCDSEIELRYRPDVHYGYYAVPIASREQMIGVLSLYADGSCRLNAEERGFLEVVAGTLAAIIERKCAEEKTVRFLEENRRLSRRLIDVQEEERKALARELHDEMGQALTAIKTESALILDRCQGAGLSIGESARAIGAAADHLYGLTHSLIRRLRPSVLDDLGLAAAIETLVSEWRACRPGLPCRLSVEGDLRGLPDAVNIAIFRIVQEALTNVLRHAVASHMSVTLCRSADAVLVRVEDDGRGLDPAGVKRTWQHFGLLGMRERVEGLGGCLDIESVAGRGLCLNATIPVAADADREP